MCRYRKVSTSVRMCEPSTSASVMTMTRWYRSAETSNSSPIPVPMAVIIAWISLFESTLLMRFFSLLMIFPRSGSTAWYVRSRPIFAGPPAESPSTMKSSAASGSRMVQSASLPGSDMLSSADLRRGSSRAVRGAWRARGGDRLVHDLPRVGGVLLEKLRELRVDRRFDEARNLRIAELALRLTFELRVLQLHRDDRRQAFAHVLALEVVLLLLQ